MAGGKRNQSSKVKDALKARMLPAAAPRKRALEELYSYESSKRNPESITPKRTGGDKRTNLDCFVSKAKAGVMAGKANQAVVDFFTKSKESRAGALASKQRRPLRMLD